MGSEAYLVRLIIRLRINTGPREDELSVQTNYLRCARSVKTVISLILLLDTLSVGSVVVRLVFIMET